MTYPVALAVRSTVTSMTGYFGRLTGLPLPRRKIRIPDSRVPGEPTPPYERERSRFLVTEFVVAPPYSATVSSLLTSCRWAIREPGTGGTATALGFIPVRLRPSAALAVEYWEQSRNTGGEGEDEALKAESRATPSGLLPKKSGMLPLLTKGCVSMWGQSVSDVPHGVKTTAENGSPDRQ